MLSSAPQYVVGGLHPFVQLETCGIVPAVGVACWLCGGEASTGQLVDAWLGSSFTGFTAARAPSSEWICECCVYVCGRLSPVPGRPPKEGKEHGGNWRNYSHLYDNGNYSNASKGEKDRIRAFLRSPKAGPWFAAIADSGQKHVLPFAPMNPRGARGGVVRFEELDVVLPPTAAGWKLLDDIAELLTMGATKDELSTGQFTPRAWELCGEHLHRFAATWGGLRGGGWYSLALWLAQRDEAETARRVAAQKEAREERRQGKAANAHRRGTARAPSGVPREPRGERAEALGHPSREDDRSGEDEHDARGVDDQHVPSVAAHGAEQLGLFGAGGSRRLRSRARVRS